MLAISPSVQTRTCPHDKVEHLGTDFSAEFYRCEACGAVLVMQGRRIWRVSRADMSA